MNKKEFHDAAEKILTTQLKVFSTNVLNILEQKENNNKEALEEILDIIKNVAIETSTDLIETSLLPELDKALLNRRYGVS